jgi:hypothetical protein
MSNLLTSTSGGYQHVIPENFLARIGDITVSFSCLEAGLQTLVGCLIGGKPGMIVTAEMSFKNLRGLVVSLCKGLRGEGEELKEIGELMKRAAKIEEVRNQITHSTWCADTAGTEISRLKITAKQKHGLKHQFTKVSEADLRQVALDIMTLVGEIHQFTIKVVDPVLATRLKSEFQGPADQS